MMTASINRHDRPRWHRVEPGFYTYRVGLKRALQIVHKDDTPADKLHIDRWVVRLVADLGSITELERFSTYREARRFADDWRASL